MKIKLDENLPLELRDLLASLGHSVDTVHDEGLQGHVDADVWRAAQSEGRFLVTQDLDFSDSRRFQPGTHFGILLVRLRQPTRRQLIERLMNAMEATDVEGWDRCLVILSESRIRVRRPTG